MGGKDVLHMKQLQISNMEPFTFLQLLKQLADRKFAEDTDGSPLLDRIVSSGLPKVPKSPGSCNFRRWKNFQKFQFILRSQFLLTLIHLVHKSNP